MATLPALSGLLLGLSFPPVDWHGLAWIALVPLAWCWTRPQLPRSAYWTAFGGGVVAHLLALSWLRTSYRYDSAWLGPYADVWLSISMLCAIAFLAMFWYGRRLTSRTRLPMTFVLPITWVSYEFVRFSIGILFDQTGFPWAKLAITQVREGGFLQVADLGGEYLLSFLIAMVSGAIVDVLLLWEQGVGVLRRGGEPPLAWRVVGPLVAVVLLLAVVGYGHWRVSQQCFESGPVACLMGEMDLPPFLDRGRIATAVDGPNHPTDWPDLLLWPELALHHKLLDGLRAEQAVWQPKMPPNLAMVTESNPESYSRKVKNGLTEAAQEIGSAILIGCERYQAKPEYWQRYNSLVCVDPRRGLMGSYDKCFPVPWAEFMPYVDPKTKRGENTYDRGDGAKLFEITARRSERAYRCLPVLCYDLCFASLFRTSMAAANQQGKEDFIVHCGAEGQDLTGVLSEWMLRAARLRAVENRRAIVRNVSYGKSGIVDSNGHLLVDATPKVIEKPIYLGAIPIDDRTSWYALIGNWPLMILCIVTAIATAVSRQSAAYGGE